MCKKSESITELAKALVKFNTEVRIIEKDAKNPHFKNQYATLDNIIDEVRPLLAKHGLSVMQFPGGDGEKFTMTTMLIHDSGEWIESEPIVMRPVKNDPQGIGSCATYARRYSLAAFLSLNTGEDDDGNNASHVGEQKGSSQPQEPKSEVPTLKAKWQVMKGDLEGFDDWYNGQKSNGYSDAQMNAYLTKKMTEKKKETAHVN